MGTPEIFAFFFVLVFMVLIFFAVRSVMLWYWKIDKIVANQDYQNQSLEYQNKLLQEQLDLLKSFKNQMGNSSIDPNKEPLRP